MRPGRSSMDGAPARGTGAGHPGDEKASTAIGRTGPYSLLSRSKAAHDRSGQVGNAQTGEQHESSHDSQNFLHMLAPSIGQIIGSRLDWHPPTLENGCGQRAAVRRPDLDGLRPCRPFGLICSACRHGRAVWADLSPLGMFALLGFAGFPCTAEIASCNAAFGMGATLNRRAAAACRTRASPARQAPQTPCNRAKKSGRAPPFVQAGSGHAVVAGSPARGRSALSCPGAG